MKKINIEKICKILYLLAYTFLSIYAFMDKVVFIIPYISYFKYLGILTLTLVYIYSFLTSKLLTKIITLSINILGIITYIVSKDINFFIFCLSITSMKCIKFESLMRYDLCLKVIIVMSVMSFYYLNMTKNLTIVRDGIDRISFGFSHPNTFAMIFSMIILEIFYVFRNKRDKIHYLLLFATIFYLDYFTGSRASVITLMLFAFFLLISKPKFIKRFMNTKIMRFLTENSFTIFAVLSFVMIYKFNNGEEFATKLNELISGRIKYAARYFEDYKINLLGNNIPIIGTDISRELKKQLLVIDNTYVYVLLRFGILSYISYASSYFLSAWHSFKEKNKMYLICSFTLLIYGLVETYTYKIPFNTFLLLIGDVIYNTSQKKNKNKKRNKQTITISKDENGIILINNKEIDTIVKKEIKNEEKTKKTYNYY